jgi:hypothetical protein
VIRGKGIQEKTKREGFAFRVFERSGGAKRETEPASDSSLEGSTSSPNTIVKSRKINSRPNGVKVKIAQKRPEKTSSDHIYYNVNWRNVPEYFPGGRIFRI